MKQAELIETATEGCQKRVFGPLHQLNQYVHFYYTYSAFSNSLVEHLSSIALSTCVPMTPSPSLAPMALPLALPL